MHQKIMCALVLGTAFLVGCESNSDGQPEHQPTVDEQVAALYARLDNDPDPLHTDYTPAVHELIKIGRPAVATALDLMLSHKEITRVHAQSVLQGVTMCEHGFVFGQGWKKPDGEARFRQFWIRLGDLDYGSTAESRAARVAKWREWLAAN